MKHVLSTVANFLKRADGPTAVEYAVLLALVVLVCLSAIAVIGGKTANNFNQVPSPLGKGAGS